MSAESHSYKEIQQILDENDHLIKVIVKYQRGGRILDAMLYQTRLQLNLVHLASIADNRPAPSAGLPTANSTLGGEMAGKAQSGQLARFVRVVKENGLSDIHKVAQLTDIPLERIVPLAKAYIAFLKRHNRFTEAEQHEKALSLVANSTDRCE